MEFSSKKVHLNDNNTELFNLMWVPSSSSKEQIETQKRNVVECIGTLLYL